MLKQPNQVLFQVLRSVTAASSTIFQRNGTWKARNRLKSSSRPCNRRGKMQLCLSLATIHWRNCLRGHIHVSTLNSIVGLHYFFLLIADYESYLMLDQQAPNFCPAMNIASIVLFIQGNQVHHWSILTRRKLRTCTNSLWLVWVGGMIRILWTSWWQQLVLFMKYVATRINIPNHVPTVLLCLKRIDTRAVISMLDGCVFGILVIHELIRLCWMQNTRQWRTMPTINWMVTHPWHLGSCWLCMNYVLVKTILVTYSFGPWHWLPASCFYAKKFQVCRQIQSFGIWLLFHLLVILMQLPLKSLEVVWSTHYTHPLGRRHDLTALSHSALAWLPAPCRYQEWYLFPSETDILNSTLQPDMIPYAEYQSHYKEIIHKVIGNMHPGPFGSHSNRKTAYLMAVWGGGEESDIMKSAHHSSLNNAMMYKRDAMYLLKVSQHNGLKPETIVPEWKLIYCEDVQLVHSKHSLHM